MNFDLIIVGAGPTGLCLARSLAGTGLRIALIDQQDRSALADPPYDGREIALTQGSATQLRALGLWDRIDASEIAPLRDAQVINGSGSFALVFKHPAEHKSELGFLISNHQLRRAAFACADGAEGLSTYYGQRVVSARTSSAGAEVQLADGTRLDGRLLVAADNRFSETRRALGIAANMHDFGRTMMVCRMRHEVPHNAVATEWFDYGQTFAMLPLQGDRSSIILTLPRHQLDPLLAMDPAAFARAIETRMSRRMGSMQLEGERHAYPLVGVYARRFVAERCALLGDAAVGMHPVTAHGFNFGLRSQETLARVILAARGRSQDFASASVLAQYEREHQRATRGLYLATLALVRLYTNDRLPARLSRSLALRVADKLGPLKNLVVEGLTAESLDGGPLPGLDRVLRLVA